MAAGDVFETIPGSFARARPMNQAISKGNLTGALALAILVNTAAAQIVYVDDDAPPGGDGRSWNSAFNRLDQALAAVPREAELRIAQGVYKPTTGLDPSATFEVAGVALRGGYAGLGAPDPDARDWALYRTVLSGDLLANDGPPGSFENYNDNARHIMT